MSMDMLEWICEGSQSNPGVNRRGARYKICDSIKERQSEWKGVL